MKEYEIQHLEHTVCIILGSNIQPEVHIPLAIRLLKKTTCIKKLSSVWETQAVGIHSQNFINVALLTTTVLSIKKFKYQVLRSIEARLGRQRTINKFSPRTIDIDIVLFDQKIIDPLIWSQPYITIPCSEILPDLIDTNTGESLRDNAQKFGFSNVKKRLDILQNISI